MKILIGLGGFGVALSASAIGLFAPPAGRASVAAPKPPSLCRAGEQPLFQCRIGRRQVALCAGGGTGMASYVQYRFGRPGKVELAYPREGLSGLSWARIGYSGGGEMQVNFENEGHRYVLYSRMVRTRFDGANNAPRFSAGVAVIRGNRILSDRECTDTDVPWIEEAPTEKLLPEGQPTEWGELENPRG